eukprot:1179764-Prorocentrum_minimum.AAC.5
MAPCTNRKCAPITNNWLRRMLGRWVRGLAALVLRVEPLGSPRRRLHLLARVVPRLGPLRTLGRAGEGGCVVAQKLRRAMLQ